MADTGARGLAAKRGSLHLNMLKMRDCALLDLRSSLSCVEALFSRSNPALFQTRREQNANKKEVHETSPADPGSPLAFIRKVGPALLQLGVVVPAVLSQRGLSPHTRLPVSRTYTFVGLSFSPPYQSFLP